MHKYLLLLSFSLLLACQSGRQAAQSKEENPPAPGFNLKGSDTKAIQVADEVMKAMGGRKAWDDTRYLSWLFFGRRQHYWDKWTGDVRIESSKDSTIYLLNLHSMKGKVRRRGKVETNPDTLQMLLKRANSIWINDAYWLVMPYKLKDSGVTLKYAGEGTPEGGQPADLLQLTFEKIGDTPQNKYLVYVDKKTRLVSGWSYFEKNTDEKPQFFNPWTDYRTCGKILLSSSRGKGNMGDVVAPAQLPEGIFTEF